MPIDAAIAAAWKKSQDKSNSFPLLLRDINKLVGEIEKPRVFKASEVTVTIGGHEINPEHYDCRCEPNLLVKAPSLYDQVKEHLADGGWWSVGRIALNIDAAPDSVAAQIRRMRQRGLTVTRKKLGGLSCYKLSN